MKNTLIALVLILAPTAFAGDDNATFEEVLEECTSRQQSKQKREEVINITCSQTRDQWREEAGSKSNQSASRKLKYSVGISLDSLKDGVGRQTSAEMFTGQIDDFGVTWSCPVYRRFDVTYTTNVKFTSCAELQAVASKLGINVREPAKHSYVRVCEAYTTQTLVQGLASADPGSGKLPEELVAKASCDIVEFCAGTTQAPKSASSCDQQ
jgi:hypothetical protein